MIAIKPIFYIGQEVVWNNLTYKVEQVSMIPSDRKYLLTKLGYPPLWLAESEYLGKVAL